MADEEAVHEGDEVEALRKAIAKRIVAESDRLVDVLFGIVYDDESGARDKLSAITTLLDRSLPKMGVQHSKQEEAEERGSRRDLREEIERLMKEAGE